MVEWKCHIKYLFGKNESLSEACNCGENFHESPTQGEDVLLGQWPWSWAES